MSDLPYLSPVIRALPAMVPFVGPEALSRQRGRPFRARLGANESVFGPSPKAISVMREAASENWMYADPDNHDLKQAIARHHEIDSSNVVIGEGVDGLLGLVCKLALEPGDVVVTSDGAYPTFNFHVAAHGGRLSKVPYRDDREDLEALLDRARRENAKILYVANPDNPMGSWYRHMDIQGLIAALPEGMLLCLDEAYGEMAPPDALPPIDVSNPFVVRFHTFSKAYGLAGARIGYAMGAAELIAEFEKVRNHYGINRVGQLGALAALGDRAFLHDTLAAISAARNRLGEIARDNGFAPLPSATNFVAIDCGRDGDYARAILREVLARDCFIRMPGVAPLDRCIRVTVGTPADLDFFAEVFADAVKALR